MKKPLLIIMILLFFGEGNASAFSLSLNTTGQPQKLQYFYDIPVPSEISEAIEAMVRQLEAKKLKQKNELHFLKSVFYTVHRQVLKKYKEYSTVENLLTQGHYNCVSGTALYALLLDRLEIPYQIWEMNYHVYLTVPIAGMQVMFETTDPQQGWITDLQEIQQRIDHFLEEADQYHQALSISAPLIHRPIQLRQLAGLQYYNLALEEYRQQNRQKSQQYIRKAITLYPSERIAAFERNLASALHSEENRISVR